MVFCLILFLMPLTGLLYTAYVTIKDDTKMLDRISTRQPVNPYSLPGLSSRNQSRREIKWISTKEFESVLVESEDLIVIDLISAIDKETVPYLAAHVLPLGLIELPHLLKWLPPATNVVLYGDLDLYLPALRAAHDLAGSAPVYVLIEAAIRCEGRDNTLHAMKLRP